MFRIKLVFISIFLSNCLFAQTICDSSSKLSNGIYLQNLDITLPWEIDFSNLEKLGVPKIIPKGDLLNTVYVRWDSVLIFEDFKVNLFILTQRENITKGKTVKLRDFRGVISYDVANRMVAFFKVCTKKNGRFVSRRKKQWLHYWLIEGYRIDVARQKKNCYFGIEKRFD